MNHRSARVAPVHMVGSMPLESAEDVFRTLGSELGKYLDRIPDGETGRRRRWIRFIADQLKVHPDLEVDASIPPYQFKQWDGKLVFEFRQLRFRGGVDPATVKFNTGYAEDALRNYRIFERLQREGAIPPGVKYQICSATPLAIAYLFVAPGARADFARSYGRHLQDEARRIVDALPNDRITYQWDVCLEVLMWEGYFPQPEDYKDEILSSLGEIGGWVPEKVDLGYHLCYGSPQDQHMVQPKDMGVLVEIAQGIFERVKRPVLYVHMPVPRDRADDAYFKPLERLKLPAGTALYLGLVHADDTAGNANRLAAARRYAKVDGVSAECGLGRSDPERIASALEEHRRLAGLLLGQ